MVSRLPGEYLRCYYIWSSAESRSRIRPNCGGPIRPAPSSILLILLDSSMRGDPVCSDWPWAFEKFDGASENGEVFTQDVPADEWIPEEKALNHAVVPIMKSRRTTSKPSVEGRREPILEDFAVLSAQYRRLTCLRCPPYTSVDNYLVNASTNLGRSR